MSRLNFSASQWYSRERLRRVPFKNIRRYSIPHHHHIISYHIISYHITSYHIISYHIISYLIISYHISSYHIISYHIISSYHHHLIIIFSLSISLSLSRSSFSSTFSAPEWRQKPCSSNPHKESVVLKETITKIVKKLLFFAILSNRCNSAGMVAVEHEKLNLRNTRFDDFHQFLDT